MLEPSFKEVAASIDRSAGSSESMRAFVGSRCVLLTVTAASRHHHAGAVSAAW